MKKNISIVFLLISFFYSCNRECKNLDCDVSSFSGQFRILDKTNGKDLVFGSGAIYDKNKIKFFAINITDTIFFQSEAIKYGGNGYDSILYVNFLPAPSGKTFIKLNNFDVDTLDLTYVIVNSKCCGTITSISNFLYNNSYNIGNNRETREIKK